MECNLVEALMLEEEYGKCCPMLDCELDTIKHMLLILIANGLLISAIKIFR